MLDLNLNPKKLSIENSEQSGPTRWNRFRADQILPPANSDASRLHRTSSGFWGSNPPNILKGCDKSNANKLFSNLEPPSKFRFGYDLDTVRIYMYIVYTFRIDLFIQIKRDGRRERTSRRLSVSR